MDDVLIQTSQAGDIDKLYKFITNDAAFLKRIDEIMFEDTPLHVAALAGQTCFSMEVMNLMPSFARKLNKDGLSPMHLALSKGHSELVLLLLRADQELVRVKGRGGITPLHYATQIGKIHLLAIFLAACPKSIEDVTVQSETVFHIAVKNNRLEALEVLVGWLQRVCHKDTVRWNTNIPNWRDKKGDTVLDIAVSKMQIEAIQLLAEVNNVMKQEALVALQIRTKMSRKVIRQMLRRTGVSKASFPKGTETLANYLRSKTKFDERIAVVIGRFRARIPEYLSTALPTFAGVLMAATLQAALTPPGDVLQGNSNPIIWINGTSINTTVSNTTANGGSPSNDAVKSVKGGESLVVFVVNCLFFVTFFWIGLLFPHCALLMMPLIFGQLLVVCASASALSPDSFTAIFIFMILLLFFILLLSIFGIYTQGTTKIQQLWYNADKCPKNAVAEEVKESGARTTTAESVAQTVTSP